MALALTLVVWAMPLFADTAAEHAERRWSEGYIDDARHAVLTELARTEALGGQPFEVLRAGGLIDLASAANAKDFAKAETYLAFALRERPDDVDTWLDYARARLKHDKRDTYASRPYQLGGRAVQIPAGGRFVPLLRAAMAAAAGNRNAAIDILRNTDLAHAPCAATFFLARPNPTSAWSSALPTI